MGGAVAGGVVAGGAVAGGTVTGGAVTGAAVVGGAVVTTVVGASVVGAAVSATDVTGELLDEEATVAMLPVPSAPVLCDAEELHAVSAVSTNAVRRESLPMP